MIAIWVDLCYVVIVLLLMLIGMILKTNSFNCFHAFLESEYVSCVNISFCFHFIFRLPISLRCTPPHKSTDYQKIYSDWCNEFEKYKSAMKSWEKKQVVCRNWSKSISCETNLFSNLINLKVQELHKKPKILKLISWTF